jgi:hypothetical protein
MYYIVEMAFGHHCSDGELLQPNRIETVKNLGLSTLTQLFSGGWVNDCRGGYKSVDGHCVLEPCSQLTAYAREVGEDEWSQLLILASEIATKLEQECVLITIHRVDGVMHWVKPDASTSERGEQAA